MKRALSVFCVLAVSAAALWILAARRGCGQAETGARGVVPFLAVVVDTMYSPADNPIPSMSLTRVYATRADGASVEGNVFTSPDGEHLLTRAVELPDRYVAVDPDTQSVTTYGPEKPPVRAAQSCPGTAAGEILGYKVTLSASQINDSTGVVQTSRKAWRAPALNCFPLREEERTFSSKLGRAFGNVVVAVSVRVGPPPQDLFAIPDGYVERSPSEVMAQANARFPASNVGCCSTPALDRAYDANRPK